MLLLLFDSYIFVDWSARNSPSPAKLSRDSVWVGETSLQCEEVVPPTYHRTRIEGVEYVTERLHTHVAAGRRVLLGFDFSYGYPRGFGSTLGQHGATSPWRVVWDELALRITDGQDNVNNRFHVASTLNERLGPGPGPFWGVPPKEATQYLTKMRKGKFEYPYVMASGVKLQIWRLTEKHAKCQGFKPHSVWQLLGNGAVGSQALVGIPRLRMLRNAEGLADCSKVWPFETGFTHTPSPTVGPFVLHAEVFPNLVDGERDRNDPIPDRAQVLALAKWAREQDLSEKLAEMFTAPDGLTPVDRHACEVEEGWILGVR
jgi:hypothetical protein